MTRGVDPPNRRAPSDTPQAGRQRFDTATHLAKRHQEAARARVVRRRRAVAALCTVVVVAGVVVACNAVTSSGKDRPTTTTGSGPSSTARATTTTTLPAAFGIGIHTFDWVRAGRGITHVGPTGVAEPGRVLTTQVRYPIEGGSASSEETNAAPAAAGAPYPVIVFAHGFGTDPATYQGLLDTWVRAGFVVVSPLFPDENLATVDQYGGIDGSDAVNLEADVYSEPGDLYFVLNELDVGASDSWVTKLRSIMNFGDTALAGQSDGANVVAALAFTSKLHHLRKLLPSAPKAVAVLSGQAWAGYSYGGSATSPALLQVQSDADGCNTPADATGLYSSLQNGLSTKWFDVLFGAAHLQPYEGAHPWAAVVDAVTTKFFELELDWRPSTTSASAVAAAGTKENVSQITTTVNETTIPSVSLFQGC